MVVTDVVQAQGMGQMNVQHGHDMAVGAEGAGLILLKIERCSGKRQAEVCK